MGDERGPAREFHRLYRGGTSVLRTRSRDRLLKATIAHLDAYAEEPTGVVRLTGRLLVRDDAAVVIDPLVGAFFDVIERRVERLGYRVVDVPGAPLETDTLEISLWPPRLELDPGASDPTVGVSPDGIAARIPLRGVVAWQLTADGGWSSTQSLMALTRLVVGGPRIDEADLLLARRLLDVVEVAYCPVADDSALVEVLQGLPR